MKEEDEGARFLAALGDGLDPRRERMLHVRFRAWPRPKDSGGNAFWRRPARSGSALDNQYVTVSAFAKRPEEEEWAGDEPHFTAGLALMVDDVGPKVPLEMVSALRPTARVLTSPGNEQWWYMFEEPLRDMREMKALIAAFLARLKTEYGRPDPGMNSVTRIARVPGSTNTKPTYGGAFAVRLAAIDERRRFTVAGLCERLGLTLDYSGARTHRPLLEGQAHERFDRFAAMHRWCEEHRMVRKPRGDKTDIHCPWSGDHSDGGLTGTALIWPSVTNDWYGAFHCQHGHCEGKRLRDLEEWITTMKADSLEERNARAPETLGELYGRRTGTEKKESANSRGSKER